MTTEGIARDAARGDSGYPIPQWLWWTAAAMLATLAHIVIDAHIGLWGETSDDMSLLQAANALSIGALYGWWLLVVVAAAHGDRKALQSALLFAAVYAFLLHGLAALFAAPPPSAAFPYQDMAHVLSLITGGGAAIFVRARLRDSHRAGKGYFLVGAVVLIVVNQALGAAAFVLFG